MLTEPKTLYKLMNLYMLRRVNIPLTNAQLTDFFLKHEYAPYFTSASVKRTVRVWPNPNAFQSQYHPI